jgi:protein-tyrosine phosphatase
MCVIAAYMIKENGESAESSIRKLRALKNGAVEKGQEVAVLRYAKTVERA